MRKSFINVVPVKDCKLTASFKTPKYLNITEEEYMEFVLDDHYNYFIGNKGMRHWLSVNVTVNRDWVMVESEPIFVTAYREYPKEFQKLFCDILRQVRQELKQRRT